jgi:hypothetical protein
MRWKREEAIRRRQMEDLRTEREERARGIQAQDAAEEEDIRRRYATQATKVICLQRTNNDNNNNNNSNIIIIFKLIVELIIRCIRARDAAEEEIICRCSASQAIKMRPERESL